MTNFTNLQQLPEEVELVWDDSVAPEACIDLDAQHMSGKEVIASMLIAFGGFGALYAYCVASDPEAKNPVAIRKYALPYDGLKYELGMADSIDVEDVDE